MRVSRLAKEDIFRIAKTIAVDNHSAANRFLDAVEITFDSLSEFPEMGHKPYFNLAPNLQTIRIKGFKHYAAFYLLEDTIRILRVADMRIDLPRLFEYLQDSR